MRKTGQGPRICVVGPLPPPSGGMANQCEQLVRLLREEGLEVELVRNNEPYRPAWVGRLLVVRAGFRLLPYLFRLWSAASRAEVMHILANSGWAWHLLAAPAVVIGRARRVAVIVNYHGGNADRFFASAPWHVFYLLKKTDLRVTPSAFLLQIFAQHGVEAEVIPNIIDLSRFAPVAQRAFGNAPHLIVTRNLEPIYDIPTAIRAFARIRMIFPQARLTVAGSGPEQGRLQALVAEQGLASCVAFPGRIANADIPALYQSADCLLNPSTVDNMPISLLEAFASGVPVVSTDAGGIPDLAKHGVSAWLTPVGDDVAMADAAIRVLREPDLAEKLRQAGLNEASKYAWPQVRMLWLEAYNRVASAKGKK